MSADNTEFKVEELPSLIQEMVAFYLETGDREVYDSVVKLIDIAESYILSGENIIGLDTVKDLFSQNALAAS